MGQRLETAYEEDEDTYIKIPLMALQVSEAQAVGDWGSSIPDKHNDTLVPLPLHPCLVCWGPDAGLDGFLFRLSYKR